METSGSGKFATIEWGAQETAADKYEYDYANRAVREFWENDAVDESDAAEENLLRRMLRRLAGYLHEISSKILCYLEVTEADDPDEEGAQ